MTATERPTPLAEVLAFELASARHRAGLSARALAAKCAELGVAGVDRQRIANIEAGRGRPVGVVEFLALAYVLRAFPTELLQGPAPVAWKPSDNERWAAWAASALSLGEALTIDRSAVDTWMTKEWPAWGDEPDAGRFLPNPEPQPALALTPEKVTSLVRDIGAAFGLEVAVKAARPEKGAARGKRR